MGKDIFRKLLGPLRGARPHAATGDIDQTAVIYETARFERNGRSVQDIRVGAHSHIRGELLLFGHGGRIGIGEHCYVGEQTRIWSALSIDIGNRVLISHLCTILDNLTHPFSANERHAQFRTIVSTGQPRDIDLSERAVTIEDDVLIGCSSVILRGVRIGRGAVVGAGSVVTHDVPPLVVAAGNPASIIRELTIDERR